MTETLTKHPPAPAGNGAEALQQADNPFAAAGQAVARGGANMYGANSIETFCNAGPLSLTHDDADGWVDYVDNFTAMNFRYRDGGVKIWQYYEQYDNWQDTYGVDAVCAFYHSGHGGMDTNGVFYLPMGAAWAGNDCTAISSNMRLGNEYLRYFFLSTCESLRVLGGHSPIRTWQAANLGLRMIFGFETVSWDDARYGSNFWKHWNAGKSLGTAWLDASWDIAHDQAPSVVACGATQQEAQDRVFNERYFDRGRANTAWWWWRWYNVARTATREPNRAIPRDQLVPRFRPVSASLLSPQTLADRFGIASRTAAAAYHDLNGGLLLREGDKNIAQDRTGAITVRMASANLDNQVQLPIGQARSQAADAIRQYGLDSNTELVFDRTMLAHAVGGTTEQAGRFEPERVTETIVQFRQIINGVPVIASDAGIVRVAVDNDGRVTQLHASVREIEDLGKPGRTLSASGPEPNSTAAGATRQPRGPSSQPEHESALSAAVGQRLRDLITRGAAPIGVQTVPGTTEIGYKVRGDLAQLVARKAIEVEFGFGFRKRYWVDADISS